jgi:hypothetical protein
MKHIIALSLLLAIVASAHASPKSDELRQACAEHPEHPICIERAEKAKEAKVKREARLQAQIDTIRNSTAK